MAMIDRDRIERLGQRLAAEEVRGRSPWADARRRFLRNKAAVAGLVVLVLVLAFGLFALDLLRPRTVPRPDGTRSRDTELSPFRWHALGLLLIHCFSNPNLSMVMLWV